jgi:hypothetical protein
MPDDASKKSYKPHYEVHDAVSLRNLIVGGFSVMVISCLFVGLFLPFLLIFVIPVGLFLACYMAWSLAQGELAARQAQALAAKHLGALSNTRLNVIEQVGDTAAIVLNDWGLVFCRFGKRPIQLAWDQVKKVDETASKVLTIYGYAGEQFKLDLAVTKRFFLISASIFAKIPNVCNFDINPHTGKSNLLENLDHMPCNWKGMWGSLTFDSNGVQLNNKRISWDALKAVDESAYDAGDDPGIMGKVSVLTFKSFDESFAVDSHDLEFEYDRVRRILKEKISERASFCRYVKTARDVAFDEFCFLQETITSSLPLTKRRAQALERYYKYMLTLLDTFEIGFYPQVRRFIEDYQNLLRYTGRDAEADALDKKYP